jgi:pimeloyl-ACP methyl ester carboxylesterase
MCAGGIDFPIVWFRACVALLAAVLLVPESQAWAQTPTPEATANHRGAEAILPLPTLGGKQFWVDVLLFRQWRIQRNVLTEHCRLLDEDNWRQASGTFDECVAALEKIKRQRRLKPIDGRAVIVLHGLGRDRSVLEPVCRYLRENSKLSVYNFGYPSTQAGVAQHAQSLARVIDRLEGVTELNFVAHSLGNLVVRHYFADRKGRASPPLGRVVMLGPPNHGSEVAATLAQSDWFVSATGRAGLELGRQWAELEPHLAVPPCSFGIIAGGRGNSQGYNPLLPSDDDGLVTVASAQLAGAADFVRLPVYHGLLPSDRKVLEYTLCFLEHGYFVSPTTRHPLP